MMYLVVKNSGQAGELRLQGTLVGGEVEELKLYLCQAMRYVTDLTIDCSAVTAVDAACLQLLCSAYRLSRQQLRKFTPIGHSREVFLQAAHNANYAHCVGCGLDGERGCVWGVC
ncbi:MAG: STAS domain-containing protein [Nitrospirota bacterium]|nr:STAS domain-containing protein [Nitrospirota bacterium]